MSKKENLKVRFGEPENGWIEIRLETALNRLSLHISYTPFHFIEELIEAIIKVLDGEDAKANGSYNPERYEFVFKVENEIIHLQICAFPDYTPNENAKEVLFEHEGERVEICKAFWRSFRDLQDRVSPEKFEESFRREFSLRDLEFLSGRISQIKH